MRISVLGCGRWGSFIAWYLNRAKHQITLFGKSHSKSFLTLQETNKNEYVTLSKSIALTSSLKTAVDSAEIVIIAISAQNLNEFMTEITACDYKDKPFVLCMKGLECETGKRLSEIVDSHIHNKNNIAVWVGPGHIQCFAKNIPNCMLIDSHNRALTKKLVDTFSSDLIKFYEGNDIIGSEIGAAAKNVIGIAAGMLDGANLTTLKGALMARGAREVARLIKIMGGSELSAYGLCHLGDYETTLFSPHSQNKAFGEMFIRKQGYTKLAEGVKTADGLLLLAKKHGVEMPITEAVSCILKSEDDPVQILKGLFSRTNRVEFY